MRRGAAIGAAAVTAALLVLMSACENSQRALLPLIEAQGPDRLYRLSTDGEPVVWLTIDDGPSALTPEFAALFAQHEATATFFIHTDHIEDAEDLAALAKAGHNFGHHMPSDRDWSKDRREDFRAGFEQSHCRLQGFGDAYAYRFRPPLGRINEETMGPALDEFGIAGEKPFVLASFIPWDAGGLTETTSPPLNRLLARRYGGGLGRAARPGDIVVFHDGPRETRTQNTLISLYAFLEMLERRGLKASALPSAKPPASAPRSRTGVRLQKASESGQKPLAPTSPTP